MRRSHATYHLRMTDPILRHAMPTELAGAARHLVAGWWGIVRLGALLLDMALSRSTYTRETGRRLALHIVQDAAPMLAGFTVLTTLISLIVIRIVLVTALSYGLTQYALEMVVRVLVLELIPLTAALFAALRCTIPNAVEVITLRARGHWGTSADDVTETLRREVLPRMVSGVFSALLLAVVSCAATLVVAYLSVYGPDSAGLAAYTRTVGHVFNPAVSLILGLKVMFFGVAVALVPMAAALDAAPTRRRAASAELRGLVRMSVVILVIEAASLVGNYY